MIPLVLHHRQKIVELCKMHGVRRLELFGSAASSDTFDPSHSDIDFLYMMDHEERDDLPDRYFSLCEALEQTLGHKIDMVSLPDVKNPYFLALANKTRQVLYAA
jgi:uncharacterized protein